MRVALSVVDALPQHSKSRISRCGCFLHFFWVAINVASKCALSLFKSVTFPVCAADEVAVIGTNLFDVHDRHPRALSVSVRTRCTFHGLFAVMCWPLASPHALQLRSFCQRLPAAEDMVTFREMASISCACLARNNLWTLDKRMQNSA